MSEFLLIAIVAVSTLVGVAGVSIYLLLGTIRASLSSVEREEWLLAEAENNHLKAG
jgi:hypothetical protein